MRLMAVEHPISWCTGHEIDRANLPDPDIDRDLRPRGLLRYPTAVGARDDELNPMQMNRVIRHAEIAHANADLVSLGDHHRIDPRKDARVPCPHIEVRHFRD